jgi:hypothetical protein
MTGEADRGYHKAGESVFRSLLKFSYCAHRHPVNSGVIRFLQWFQCRYVVEAGELRSSSSPSYLLSKVLSTNTIIR